MWFYVLIVLAFLAGISVKMIYDRIHFNYKYKKYVERFGEEIDFDSDGEEDRELDVLNYLYQVNYLTDVLEQITDGETTAEEWFDKSREYAKDALKNIDGTKKG